MNKSQLRDLFIAKVQEELAQVLKAANSAIEAATHEENKAEDEHDTRGLEASYLAAGQSKRAEELSALIQMLKALNGDPQNFKKVVLGALVTLEMEAAGKTKKLYCWFVSHGGGMSVPYQGKTVTLMTPGSPLGEELLDRALDDEFELETGGVLRSYTILEIA